MTDDLDQAAEQAGLSSATAQFERSRRRLFGIAYRMLGSVAEAEDVLQEVWIRWQSTSREDVEEPGAFLAAITTRLAINVLKSARVRRETYIGPWLPEPVRTEDDPYLGAERAEALEMAVLLLLEHLSPTERAAYVLREAFDYPYARIAEILDSSPAAVRQMVSRARKHLAAERAREASVTDQQRLLSAFLAASREGDTAALERMLAADAVSYTDGGGRRGAARIPIVGRTRVAKFTAALSSHFWRDKTIGWVEVNGQPAVAVGRNGALTALLALSGAEGRIGRLLWVLSPEKLGHVGNAPD